LPLVQSELRSASKYHASCLSARPSLSGSHPDDRAELWYPPTHRPGERKPAPSRMRATGIRDRAISPGSPWQNGYVERLIGTVHRECLDQMLIFGEAHLRQILSLYASYYNESRTHLSVHKDAPLERAVQRYGTIVRPFSWGCIIAMRRYDFRKGQGAPAPDPGQVCRLL
jgi:transposase InsO family protein